MRAVATAFAGLLALTTSCSGSEREPLQQIGGLDGEYSYVLYRRGAMSTNYITIEQQTSAQESLVSISHCDAIAARVSNNKLEVVGFNARMSIGRLDSSSSDRQPEIHLQAYGRAPTQADLRFLTDRGFMTIRCEEYL